MAIIEIKNLTKYFPKKGTAFFQKQTSSGDGHVTALQDVSFEVSEAGICCIMGSNGAGKTTLIKILSGLVLPTSGHVRILGKDLNRRLITDRIEIGVALNDRPGFYDRLSARQNLEFFCALYGFKRKQASKRIAELIDLLELDEPDRQYQMLSSGMKQRLVIARALLHDPKILMMDEPTRSLDPVQTAKIHSIIKDRLQGEMKKTILLSSHQVWEVESLAESIGILHCGELRAFGKIGSLTSGESLRALVHRVCQ